MPSLERMFELREAFDQVKTRYDTGQATHEELSRAVREVESEQRRLDHDSGFVEAQMKIHDLCVRVPSDESTMGTVGNDRAVNLTTSVQDIIKVSHPAHANRVGLSLVGIGAGSTVLFYDIVERPQTNSASVIDAERSKEIIKNTLEGAKTFLSIGFSQERLVAFRELTGLDNEQAYQLTKTLLKMTPASGDEINRVELAVNTGSSQTVLSAETETAVFLAKSKSDIYKLVKPEEQTVLEGKLGIMEEWEVNHKVVIIEPDGRKFTVNYSPTAENIRKIKDNIGHDVKLLRARDEDDNRKWILVEWLS